LCLAPCITNLALIKDAGAVNDVGETNIIEFYWQKNLPVGFAIKI
jgi:hypothetical protein